MVIQNYIFFKDSGSRIGGQKVIKLRFIWKPSAKCMHALFYIYANAFNISYKVYKSIEKKAIPIVYNIHLAQLR